MRVERFDSISDSQIDEKLLHKLLHNLIEGQNCLEEIKPTKAQKLHVIYAKDKDIIDANKVQGNIVFEGNELVGGIYDAKHQNYFSDNKKLQFELKDEVLSISSICSKQSFVIKNFDKSKKSFGIKLSENPTKEIAIVIDVSKKVLAYVDAFRDITPFIAKHIFQTDKSDTFAKISLITFAHIDVIDLGTFYEPKYFIDAMKQIKILDTQTHIPFSAIIKGMRNFTKDNYLKKEVFILTGNQFGDPHNAQKAIEMTQNLNRNIAFNSGGCEDNCVKIHSFAFEVDLPYLKELSSITKGEYYCNKSTFEFQKNILIRSNDGKDIDPSELKREIHSNKTHKIYDPDNPNDNPPTNYLDS